MIDERQQILALTQIAFLNAVFLSAMSVQFFIPFMFLLFLWILPAIFALQIQLSPARLVITSIIIMLFFCLAIFGFSIVLWSLIYAWIGVALAISWRYNSWVFRLFLTSLAFALGLILAIIGLGWLGQLSLWDLVASVRQWSNIESLSFTLGIFVSLIIWSGILSICVNWFFLQIKRHVDTEMNWK